MSKAYEFQKKCGSFFVLTINGDYLAGKPFGAVSISYDLHYPIFACYNSKLYSLTEAYNNE